MRLPSSSNTAYSDASPMTPNHRLQPSAAAGARAAAAEAARWASKCLQAEERQLLNRRTWLLALAASPLFRPHLAYDLLQ